MAERGARSRSRSQQRHEGFLEHIPPFQRFQLTTLATFTLARFPLPPSPTTTMGDEETNLIDQLAAGMGDDTLDTNNESKSNSTLATGEEKKSDQDQMEEAAKRRAEKKKLKTT